MDNATYDELSVTPISSDATYSRLRMTHNNVRPSDDLTRRADINQYITKEVKQIGTKEAPSSTKVTTAVLITMIAILLILMLISVVLSVVTFSRLTSEQSKLASQIGNQNEDIKSELIQLTQIQNNISQLNDRVNDFISTQFNPSQCGAGLWWRVAYQNMTEHLHQCPSAWRKYNTSGVRACGRPESSTGSCDAVFYFPNRQYSRVCGRIIGYQVASPDAFRRFNKRYGDLDGVIISHGAQQDHIWSFAAGVTEEGSKHRQSNCPCSPEAGTQPPENTRGKCNYFCESGNSDNDFERGRLYSSDRLWDGQQCEGSCCEGNQSPPWFSVQLPAPTTDVIKVSICCDESTMNEDTPVELIEIYVQ